MAPASAQDNKRWVTDQLEVDMRRGQSNRHAIIRMVPSGTAVDVLEDDAASGYSRIRTPSGAEGWVLSRYLQRQPTARLQLPQLESRLASLTEKGTDWRSELDKLQRERDELRRQVEDLDATRGGLQRELTTVREASANALRIQAQNQDLATRLAASEQRIVELETANRELSGQSNRNWFIAGGSVLGAGIVFGLVLPRIRWKRRSSWNRL
jgi:SH3 domain protein